MFNVLYACLNLHVIQFILLIVLTVQDLKSQRISVLLLIVFNAITLLYLYPDFNLNWALAITLSIIVVKLSFILLLSRSVIGNGDILLIFPLLASLPNGRIALFLILTGVFSLIFGYCWGKLRQQHSFPLVPSLALAYACCIFAT